MRTMRTMSTTPAVAPSPTESASVETTKEVWSAYLAHRAAEKYTVALRTFIVMAVVATCITGLTADGNAIELAVSISIVVSLVGAASSLRFTMFGKHHVESLVTGVATACLLGLVAHSSRRLNIAQNRLDACTQANNTSPTPSLEAHSNLSLDLDHVTDFGCKSFARQSSNSKQHELMNFWMQVSHNQGAKTTANLPTQLTTV